MWASTARCAAPPATAPGRCRCRRSSRSRNAWRAFVAAYVQPPYVPSAPALDGLEQVESMMPSRVRVPAELVTAYQARQDRLRQQQASRAGRMGRTHRNREIRAALKLGYSTTEVARMFAVSERTVQAVS